MKEKGKKNKNTKEQRDGASYRERKKDRDKSRKKKIVVKHCLRIGDQFPYFI